MARLTLLESDLPLLAAPMAGGASTPALAAAVAGSGAFAFLAGGYKTPEALAAEIGETRRATPSFGVNLFAPTDSGIDETDFRRYAEQLQPDAAQYGIDLATTEPVHDDDRWADKLDLLLSDPVPVVSVTFGLPSPPEVRALQRAGSRVLATVTTVDEGRAAAAIGVDALVAQGSAAGGHSGTSDPHRVITPTPTAGLTRALVEAVGLPVVAAGGVDGPRAVAELLAAGANAVAVGTLLLRTDESGASTTHKNALADPRFRETVLTRAFTGRFARGLRNHFVDRHDAAAPAGYPAVHHLTKAMRAAAAAAGDPHGVHLWAGTGYRNASVGPARDTIHHLAGAI